MGNLNRPRITKNMEAVIKLLPMKKSIGPDGFTGEFCETFKEELILIFINRFKAATDIEETLPNSFYKANITLT